VDGARSSGGLRALKPKRRGRRGGENPWFGSFKAPIKAFVIS